MVRVTKQTNIFNLIENKDSTVDDFKKLYEIAPEKFKLVKNNYNLIGYAEIHDRPDLIEYFKTVIEPEKIDINTLLKSLKNPEKFKELVENIDLNTLTDYEKQTLLRNIIVLDNETDKIKLFDYVYNNPKGSIDIDFEISISIIRAPILHHLIKYKSDIPLELISKLIDKYHIDLNKEVNGHTLLYDAILSLNYKIIKLLFEKGADLLQVPKVLESSSYMGFFLNQFRFHPGSIKFEDIKKILNLFLENGANIDSPTNALKYSLLMTSIGNNSKDIFDFLLEKGADLNYVAMDLSTPLLISFLNENTYYLETLIKKGADVNKAVKKEKYSILQLSIEHKKPLNIITLLLNTGADKNYKDLHLKITPLEIALKNYLKDKEYFGKVIELLGYKIPKPKNWSGFTRSDIEKFDIFFEKPYDWSCCPICLEYVERSDGCMYMSHDCTKSGHYYHKKLFETFGYSRFDGAPKKVEWCTVCGRITKEHKHYKLTSVQDSKTDIAPLNPEIQERLARGDNQAFFDNANCIGFGGGGTEEKAFRFRRLREFALELQEDVDKRKHEEVMDELIEEVWNAPLVRNKKIKKILEDKRWNINVKEFPENKRNKIKNNDTNAPNVPYDGVLPTIIDEHCIIMGEDDDANTRDTNPKIYFHHETIGGLDHNGIYICQKDLAKAIEIKCAEFGLEDFGKCWWPNCKAILHPEELKNKIPEVLYNDYKKKFNKKMAKKNGGGRKTRKLKKQSEGNKESVLHELKNGTCSPPNFTHDGKLRKI